MAYTTAAKVKEYAGISGSGDDTLIGDLIVRAQEIIDKYVGFPFESSSDVTRYFSPDASVNKRGDRLTLYFDTWLAALASSDPVNINADGTPEAVAAANRYLLPLNEGPPYYGIRILPSKGVVWEYTDDPDKGVSVEGKWAWATSAPDDIVHAAVRMTVFLYRQKDNTADLDRPLLTGDGSVILPSTIPNDVRSILDDYIALSDFAGRNFDGDY